MRLLVLALCAVVHTHKENERVQLLHSAALQRTRDRMRRVYICACMSARAMWTCMHMWTCTA